MLPNSDLGKIMQLLRHDTQKRFPGRLEELGVPSIKQDQFELLRDNVLIQCLKRSGVYFGRNGAGHFDPKKEKLKLCREVQAGIVSKFSVTQTHLTHFLNSISFCLMLSVSSLCVYIYVCVIILQSLKSLIRTLHPSIGKPTYHCQDGESISPSFPHRSRHRQARITTYG